MHFPRLLALLAPTLVLGCALDLGESCPAPLTGENDGLSSFEDPTRFLAVDHKTYERLRETLPASFELSARAVVDGAAGEVVILSVAAEDVATLSTAAHAATHRCGGFTAHSSLDSALLRARAKPETLRTATLSYVIDNRESAELLIGETKEEQIFSTIQMLSSFRNRHHASPTGAEASLWLRDYWTQLAGSRTDVTVEQVSHNSTPQKSVMMTINGTDLASEVVILGAHLDSLAGGSDAIAPGADDDASGIAVITEIGRVIFETGFRPRRTIKLIGYAAEEVGLRGSAEIAASFAAQNVDVAAVMQLDMTNYQGSATDISFIRDYTNDPLTDFVASLADTYLPSIRHNNGQCGYACSDHASWNAEGFPTVYPFEADFEGANPAVHTQNDTLSIAASGASHSHKFAKLAAAFVAEVAKGAPDADAPGGGDTTPPPPGGGDSGGEDGEDGGICR